MGYYKFINGLKWYYRLKPQKDHLGIIKRGLFSDTPRHTLTNALIVASSYHDQKSNKICRLYTYFKSYLEYGIYQLKLPSHERCFYEIILGESGQKPHFDVDIDDKMVDGEAVKDGLITAIIETLAKRGIILRLDTDILLYTSHGANKQSYHVIVNNYCHANNIEAKAFYDNVIEVISIIDSTYVQWIDRAVYSPTQQFRIVGSQKVGSDRIKIFNQVWTYKGNEIINIYPEQPDSPEHEMVMQLEASIVGFTGNCKFLPPFEPRADQIKQYSESGDITLDDATQAINLIGKAGNIRLDDQRFPYKFQGINGPIVMLTRIRPSRCKICMRTHQHENPYLLVVGEEKNVFFFCRRAPEQKKIFLGKLNPVSLEETWNQQKPGTGRPSPEQIKSENFNMIWSANMIDKVKILAQSGNTNDKKYISSSTKIEPKYRNQFINLYINSK